MEKEHIYIWLDRKPYCKKNTCAKDRFYSPKTLNTSHIPECVTKRRLQLRTLHDVTFFFTLAHESTAFRSTNMDALAYVHDSAVFVSSSHRSTFSRKAISCRTKIVHDSNIS